MAPVRPHIKLIHGDILNHLPELFAHSHVFLFDARFVDSTWHILAHLLSYLSGVTEQVVISCQLLHTCNADLICGDPVTLTLSGGKQSFTRTRLQGQHTDEASSCGGGVREPNSRAWVCEPFERFERGRRSCG